MTYPIMEGPELRALEAKTIKTNRILAAAKKWREEQYKARKKDCQAKLSAEWAAKKLAAKAMREIAERGC